MRKRERSIKKEPGSKKWVALFELMIALLFIGIMAGCSNPTGTNSSSSNATARKFEVVTKQWEAKRILQQIYAMEQAYQEKHDFYWPNGGTAIASASYPKGFATLGITIMPYARYTYVIGGIGGYYGTFDAVATCGFLDDDPTLDVWMIDDTGNLRVISDDGAD